MQQSIVTAVDESWSGRHVDLSEKQGIFHPKNREFTMCQKFEDRHGSKASGARPSGTPPFGMFYCAILLRTYCRIPPLAMYSTSAGTSTLHRVSNSSFWPSR